MRIGLLFCVALLAACGAPGSRPPVGAVDTLPGGPWTLGARTDGAALLAAPEDGSGAVPVLAWRPGGRSTPSTAGVLRVTLPGEASADPVRLGRARLDGETVVFGIPLAGPRPVPLGEGDDHLLEAGGTLWTVTEAGEASRLVADSGGGHDRRTLEGRQQEGVVILYWATAPAVSPDGGLVAYATNREAVAAGTAGQSVWLLDRATGQERALIRRAGQWYRPEGWLGEELVFTGGFGGVRAIEPRTGRTRTVTEGMLVAASPAGSALAVALDVPDATRLQVLWEGGTAEIPPPDGTLFVPQGVFAPDGRRLLLQASTRDGMTRTFGVLDLGEDPPVLRWIDLPAPPIALDGWPEWLDDRTLLVTAAGRGRERGAGSSFAVTVP